MYDAILTWIKDFFTNLLGWAIEKLYLLYLEIFQGLIDLLCFTIKTLGNLIPDLSSWGLPPLPSIVWMDSVSTGIFGVARWLLPIDILVNAVSMVPVLAAFYFTTMTVMRWAKIV